MKKILLLLLALCLLVTPMMPKASADDHDRPASPELLLQGSAPDVIFPAGTVPADSALLDGIRLPIHALVLSMAEHGLSYDAQSPDFVWTGLYYALSLYGQADERAQVTGDALVLPSESVQDFTHALFTQVEALPPIPPRLSGYVRREAASDTYHLALGDFAETRLRLSDPIRPEDGTYLLEGTLNALEDDSPLCSFRVTLSENDTMFGFSVLDVSLN